MNAICLKTRGGPESLVYEDVPIPQPGEGEALVAVHAAGVTPTELTWMPTWTKATGKPRPFPIIPGHEFSGLISSVGHGVAGFSVGDAVFGMNDWFSNGAQAEYCLARAADIATKPLSVEHSLASLTPISALTAWQEQLATIAELIDEGKLKPISGGEFPLREARRAYQQKPIHGKALLDIVHQ